VRRQRLAMAGGIFATVFAATVALGANFGLFGLTTPRSPVGAISSAASPGDRSSTTTPPTPPGRTRAPGRPDFASPDADD